MTDHLDPYAVLGVPRQASQDQVIHAFRALARRHHPDTRPAGADPTAGDTAAADTAAADTALRQILAAYAIVGDPARRAVYDEQHRSPTGVQRRRPGLPGHTARPQSPPSVVVDPPLDSRRPPAIRVGPVRWHS